MAEVEFGSSKVGEQVQSKLQACGLKFMYRVFLKTSFYQSAWSLGNSDTKNFIDWIYYVCNLTLLGEERLKNTLYNAYRRCQSWRMGVGSQVWTWIRRLGTWSKWERGASDKKNNKNHTRSEDQGKTPI